MNVDHVDTVPVRFAEMADLPVVFDLLRAMHAETPHAALVEARMMGFVERVMQSGAVALTLADDGHPVGTCGLLVDPPWFSDDLFVRDVWLFVHPTHRRSPHARALIRSARRYAEALSLPLFMEVAGGPAAGTEKRVQAKIRLYSRELGAPGGATWIMGAR